jgi:hypothetical protein
MSNCRHVPSNKKDWLPTVNGILKQHPYCVKCGVVKNVSSDVGKNTGYFVNVLYNLKRFLEKRGYKVTQTQIRLILKEFEERGYCDTYSISFNAQKEEFLKIAKKYIKVSEEVIRSYL